MCRQHGNVQHALVYVPKGATSATISIGADSGVSGMFLSYSQFPGSRAPGDEALNPGTFEYMVRSVSTERL